MEKSPAHKKIEEKFPDAVLDAHAQHGDETLIIRKDAILDVARLLKEDPAAPDVTEMTDDEILNMISLDIERAKI